jgi:hypothetical protein
MAWLDYVFVDTETEKLAGKSNTISGPKFINEAGERKSHHGSEGR